MAAWVVRYLLFAFGAPEQVNWMLLLGVVLHGICYDFFFVTGFMYTDQKASAGVRNQAQSMLVFFTQGVGMIFGYWIAGLQFGSTMTRQGELEAAIKAARPETEIGFFESFTKMFSQNMPESVDAALIAETMGQWKGFWLLPAGMAAVIFVLFLVAFHEKQEIALPAADGSDSETPA
jgi:hypothetical protein